MNSGVRRASWRLVPTSLLGLCLLLPPSPGVDAQGQEPTRAVGRIVVEDAYLNDVSGPTRYATVDGGTAGITMERQGGEWVDTGSQFRAFERSSSLGPWAKGPCVGQWYELWVHDGRFDDVDQRVGAPPSTLRLTVDLEQHTANLQAWMGGGRFGNRYTDSCQSPFRKPAGELPEGFVCEYGEWVACESPWGWTGPQVVGTCPLTAPTPSGTIVGRVSEDGSRIDVTCTDYQGGTEEGGRWAHRVTVAGYLRLLP